MIQDSCGRLGSYESAAAAAVAVPKCTRRDPPGPPATLVRVAGRPPPDPSIECLYNVSICKGFRLSPWPSTGRRMGS